MAKNQAYTNALHITLPVAEGVESGAPVLVGNIAGVAQTDRDANGRATVWLDGSWRIPVTGAVANVGDAVYITSGGELTATEADGDAWGIALATKAAPVAELEVAPLGYITPASAPAGTDN